MPDEHQGECLCGAVRYRTKGEPAVSIVRHCKAGQHRTGSAFGVGVYFRNDQVEFLSGELTIFQFESSETGRWFKNEFCTKCGTTVTWTLELRPDDRGIASGTFDQAGWHQIDRHIWTDSAHPWIVHPTDAIVLKGGSPPAK